MQSKKNCIGKIMSITPRLKSRGFLATSIMKLVITVDYNLNGVSKLEMEEQLHYAANFLASEGLLSGESEAIVSEWYETVEEV